MVGALAGCDAVCVLPYDPHPDYQDDDARTLARHQHHLLKAEGFFDRVADPTAGSYTLEALTDEIGRHAWEQFQQIEAEGDWVLARSLGALRPRLQAVDQFLRQMPIQELSRDGLAGLGDAVVQLAGLEGLDAHAAAVTRRLRSST